MSNQSADGRHVADLATLFKALADPTRLRMLGLMVDRERCGQELASVLALSPATVSHHLRVLGRTGLLSQTRARPYTFYRLDLAALQRPLAALADRRRVRKLAAGAGLPEDKRRVLRSFFDGSRLLQIPAQRRKKDIVFEEVLRRLPRRKVYEERQLSRFLEAIHPDYATIRRELVMGGYMERKAGRYRLLERGRAALAEGTAGGGA